MSKCSAVQRRDGAVEQVLVPAPELVDAFDAAGRIVLEVLDHRVDVGAGNDPLRDLLHRMLDPVELVPSPGVRLVEVERHAVEVTRVPLVALASHRVRLGRMGRVLADEVATECAVGTRRPVGELREPSAERGVVRARRLVLVDQRQEERPGRPVEPTPRVGLLRARHGLSAGRHDALPDAFGERRLQVGQTLRHERHPLGDGDPVGFCGARHEIKGHAHRLHRTAEHPNVSQVLARVELLGGEVETLVQHLGCNPIGVVLEVRGGERAHRGTVVLGPLGRAVG